MSSAAAAEEIAKLKQRPHKKGENSADKLLKQRKSIVPKKKDEAEGDLSQMLEDHYYDEPATPRASDRDRKAKLERSRYDTVNFRETITAVSQKISDGKQTLHGTLTSTTLMPVANNNAFQSSEPGRNSGTVGTLNAGKVMEFLYEQLRQKEEDLAMAAQLGLELTEQHQALQEEYAQVLQELEDAHNALDKQQSLIASLGSKVRDESSMSAMVSDRMNELAEENENLNNLVQALREELSLFREKESALERKFQLEQRERRRFEQNADSLDAKVRELEGLLEEAQLQSQSQETDDQAEELKVRLADALVEIDDLTKKVDLLERRLSKADVVANDAAEHNAELRTHNNRLKATVESLQASISDLQNEQSTTQASTNNRLSELLTQNVALTTQVHTLNESVSTMHYEIQEKKKHVIEVEAAKKELEAALETATASTKTKDQSVQNLETTNAQLTKDLSEAQIKVTGQEKQIGELKTTEKELRATLAIADRQNSSIAENLLALEKQNKQLTKEMSQLAAQLAQVEQLKKDVARLAEEKARVEVAEKAAGSHAHKLQDNLESLEREVKVLRAQAGTLEHEKHVLQERYQIARLAKESIEKDLENALQSGENQGSLVQDLSTQCTMLQSENQVLGTSLTKEKSEREKLYQQLACIQGVAAQVMLLVHIHDTARGVAETPRKSIVPTTPTGNNLADDDDVDNFDDESTINPLIKDAMVRYVNWALEPDFQVASRLPVESDDNSIYQVCKDGLLLCKLVNVAKEEFIDERVLNFPKGSQPLDTFQVTENHMLFLNSCKGLGCNVTSLGVEDLSHGRATSIMDVIVELAQARYTERLDLNECRELIRLLESHETAEDLSRLTREEILLRWVNYHVQCSAPGHARVTAFGTGMKDSEIYIRVLSRLYPGPFEVKHIMSEPDLKNRARTMLDLLKSRFPAFFCFLTPEALLNENPKLSFLFFASLFTLNPGLMALSTTESESVDAMFDVEGDRDARVFTLWINSLGIEPKVHNVFENLRDGITLLQLFDIIQPGLVNWDNVCRQRPVPKFKRLQNANYALKLGRLCHFSLIGIDGSNIEQGSRTLSLSLVWQMMRLHIDKMLASVSDTQIVAWANSTVQKAGKKSQMQSFKDSSLKDARFLLDLEDAMKPGIVDFDDVKEGKSVGECVSNAKYAISIARKLGATIFLTAEDIVEVKSKMILTFVGALMATTGAGKKK